MTEDLIGTADTFVEEEHLMNENLDDDYNKDGVLFDNK